MYIKSLKLNNFKCFSGNFNFNFCIPDGKTPGSGLNVLVGENNSGKSSLMEAIYFVRNKGKKNVRSITPLESEEYFVEQTFVGDIQEVISSFIQENKKETFKRRIYQEDQESRFTVKRSFTDEDEIKKILFLNKETGEFKNESGIDGPFQSFFQISNIWAKTNPEKESKFGASTVCGNLLSEISEKFKSDHKDQYAIFLQIFTETFNDDKGGLQADLNKVASETEEILNDQFGEGKLRFKFENPEPDILFSNVKIFVKDGGLETELAEKGHGMQRAVILSLLQVYAKRITEIVDLDGNKKLKPHFLFIDEPEMGLHPQAQKKLFEALRIISKSHQVFISTHSENFIPVDLVTNIFKFQKNKETGKVKVYDGKLLSIDVKQNRKFFLHHNKIFFTDRAIFVEGVDDYELYPIYLDLGKGHLKRDLYFMGGCGDYSIFKELCDGFGIKSCFVFDVDVIHKDSTVFKKYPDINGKIKSLGKEIRAGVPKHEKSANLWDKNLTPVELKQKQEILDDLSTLNLFVLPNGALETYLDNEGTVIGDGVELESIFSKIEKV
jgi:predicted ATP-dependent endonuclease of OLD family